jgi:excisionase family DNA binding protein
MGSKIISLKHVIAACRICSRCSILTIPEASVLTHISEEVLRKELKIGKLRGVIRGRGWKIHRAHLEEYVAHLYVPRKFERHVEDSRKAMQIEGNQEKRE